MLGQRKPLCQVEVPPDEIGTAQRIAAEVSELAMLRVVAPEQGPVLGSTADTKASGFNH
jgi:hypothetical protein